MPIIPRSLAVLLLFFGIAFAEDKPKSEATSLGPLTVTDSVGKDQTVKKYRITAGTRPISWLAQGDKPGPEAFVIREAMDIKFAAGVLTLVPMERLRDIAFDNDKMTMTVSAAIAGKDDKTEEISKLVGTTQFKIINKITLDAEVDKGTDGVAEVKYQGGVLKGGIKGIRFPVGKFDRPKAGRPAVVMTSDKTIKSTHKVMDLQPLYKTKGKDALSTTLMFRKTLRFDIAKIKKIVDTDDEGREIVWQVTPKEGEEASLTLLETIVVDGQKSDLIGFVARVPEGWKLFPIRRIRSILFDTTEVPKEKEKDKDKEKD